MPAKFLFYPDNQKHFWERSEDRRKGQSSNVWLQIVWQLLAAAMFCLLAAACVAAVITGRGDGRLQWHLKSSKELPSPGKATNPEWNANVTAKW